MASDQDTFQLPPFSSESIRLGSLDLSPQHDQLDKLCKLWQEYPTKQVAERVDQSLTSLQAQIRKRALDPNFSVALKERWQTWSRTTNLTKRQVAKKLRQDGQALQPQDSEDENEEKEDHEEDGIEDQELFQGQEHGVVDDWEQIRSQREETLSQMDLCLPKSLRVSQDQAVIYATRIKSNQVNCLERPFTIQEIKKPIDQNSLSSTLPRPQLAAQSTLSSGSDPDTGCPPSNSVNPTMSKATSPPLVLDISFYWGSFQLQGDADENEQTEENDDDEAVQKVDGISSLEQAKQDQGFTKPRTTYRGHGQSPTGMKRSQTIQVLSNQALDSIRKSFLCWSNDQPERVGWKQRLKAKAEAKAKAAEQANGSAVDPSEVETDTPIEKDCQDMRFALFTGRKRSTDFCILMENKLYSSGQRVGSKSWEADYATLLEPCLNKETSADPKQPKWTIGGDLSTCFDELPQIRVGQPYWMLHQGDCLHCFTIDSIRGLQPSEAAKLAQHRTQGPLSVETLSSEHSTDQMFSRVIWLVFPSMLRFTSDNKINYGVGHRILHAQGDAFYSYNGTSLANAVGIGRAQKLAYNSVMSPIRRKEESLLKIKMGKCFACLQRKGRIGITGGERVRVKANSEKDSFIQHSNIDPSSSTETQREVIKGLEDQLVSLCPQCTVLLGLAKVRKPMETGDQDIVVTPDQDQARPSKKQKQADNSTGKEAKLESLDFMGEQVELDWNSLNTEESRRNGWTLFPLY